MKLVVIQANFMALQEPQQHDCRIKTFPRPHDKRPDTEFVTDGLVNDMWLC